MFRYPSSAAEDVKFSVGIRSTSAYSSIDVMSKPELSAQCSPLSSIFHEAIVLCA
jgi:hypothetical protein